MIPVVMNGANMSNIAPKNSYIDIKDFETIAGNKYCSNDLLKTNAQKSSLSLQWICTIICLDLVNYLEKVSSDPALYASYFWWRQHYEVQLIAGEGRTKVKVRIYN